MKLISLMSYSFGPALHETGGTKEQPGHWDKKVLHDGTVIKVAGDDVRF